MGPAIVSIASSTAIGAGAGALVLGMVTAICHIPFIAYAVASCVAGIFSNENRAGECLCIGCILPGCEVCTKAILGAALGAIVGAIVQIVLLTL